MAVTELTEGDLERIRERGYFISLKNSERTHASFSALREKLESYDIPADSYITLLCNLTAKNGQLLRKYLYVKWMQIHTTLKDPNVPESVANIEMFFMENPHRVFFFLEMLHEYFFPYKQ